MPAGVWWLAWYLTMSRAGNRLTALMKAQRGDYQHGVIWLRADNQKQDEDQRLALPDYCHGAIEDLLAAHDEPLLFPWPFDQPEARQGIDLEDAFPPLPRDPEAGRHRDPQGRTDKDFSADGRDDRRATGRQRHEAPRPQHAGRLQKALPGPQPGTGDEKTRDFDSGGSTAPAAAGQTENAISERRGRLMADVNIAGPARRLLRVKDRARNAEPRRAARGRRRIGARGPRDVWIRG